MKTPRRLFRNLAFLVLLMMPITSAALTSVAHADVNSTDLVSVPCTFTKTGAGFLSFPTWYEYLKGQQVQNGTDTSTATKCTPVINQIGDTIPILIAIVEILLRLIGLISVFFVVYGAIRYATSQGQPDNTKSARQTIINAMIGVAISTVAAVAVSFLGKALTK